MFFGSGLPVGHWGFGVCFWTPWAWLMFFEHVALSNIFLQSFFLWPWVYARIGGFDLFYVPCVVPPVSLYCEPVIYTLSGSLYLT